MVSELPRPKQVKNHTVDICKTVIYLLNFCFRFFISGYFLKLPLLFWLCIWFYLFLGLLGFGITMDKETKEMARIMVLSVIPLLIMQIPSVFRFSSVLRSVTLMIALIVTVIFVFSYFIYQVTHPTISNTIKVNP